MANNDSDSDYDSDYDFHAEDFDYHADDFDPIFHPPNMPIIFAGMENIQFLTPEQIEAEFATRAASQFVMRTDIHSKVTSTEKVLQLKVM